MLEGLSVWLSIRLIRASRIFATRSRNTANGRAFAIQDDSARRRARSCSIEAGLRKASKTGGARADLNGRAGSVEWAGLAYLSDVDNTRRTHGAQCRFDMAVGTSVGRARQESVEGKVSGKSKMVETSP